MTFVFGKKIRRNYHHISLKGGYAIPLQTRLLGENNYQYVGSNKDLPGAGMRTQDLWCFRVAPRGKMLLQSQSKESIVEAISSGLSMRKMRRRSQYG